MDMIVSDMARLYRRRHKFATSLMANPRGFA
jgi:hypothetical protein